MKWPKVCSSRSTLTTKWITGVKLAKASAEQLFSEILVVHAGLDSQRKQLWNMRNTRELQMAGYWPSDVLCIAKQNPKTNETNIQGSWASNNGYRKYSFCLFVCVCFFGCLFVILVDGSGFLAHCLILEWRQIHENPFRRA